MWSHLSIIPGQTRRQNRSPQDLMSQLTQLQTRWKTGLTSKLVLWPSWSLWHSHEHAPPHRHTKDLFYYSDGEKNIPREVKWPAWSQTVKLSKDHTEFPLLSSPTLPRDGYTCLSGGKWKESQKSIQRCARGFYEEARAFLRSEVRQQRTSEVGSSSTGNELFCLLNTKFWMTISKLRQFKNLVHLQNVA